MKMQKMLWLLAVPGCLLAQANSSYTLTAHIVSSRVDQDCGVTRGESTCRAMQVIHAVIEGRLFELQAKTLLAKGILALGDYKARLAEDQRKPTGEFSREYTIQFLDGSTRTFEVKGEEDLAHR